MAGTEASQGIGKGRLRRLVGARSAWNTRRAAMHLGEKIPLHLVSGYPGSGGTWLGGMMAEYLLCAKPGGLCFQSVDGGGGEAERKAMRLQTGDQRFRCFNWCDKEAL